METLIPVRRETRDPWDIAAAMEGLFDAVAEVAPVRAVREGLWHPTMDVYNRKNEMVVELEIPGIKLEDVDITVWENHLIVEGTRVRSGEYTEDEKYFLEREYGGFHRVVHLPSDVEDKGAKAVMKDGLLVIRLPKKAREGGRKISIEK